MKFIITRASIKHDDLKTVPCSGAVFEEHDCGDGGGWFICFSGLDEFADFINFEGPLVVRPPETFKYYAGPKNFPSIEIYDTYIE